MDKIIRVDDDKLRAELQSMLSQSNVSTPVLGDRKPMKSTTTDDDTEMKNIDPENTPKTHSIEEQIVLLRKQLNESYKIFINARDSLARISFAGIEKKFQRESELLIAKIDSDDTVDEQQLSETTNKRNIFDLTKQIGSIPELSTLFRVVNQLQCGVRNMEHSHKMMTDLGEDVADAMEVDSRYVANVRERLAHTVAQDDIRNAERMVDLEMAD